MIFIPLFSSIQEKDLLKLKSMNLENVQVLDMWGEVSHDPDNFLFPSVFNVNLTDNELDDIDKQASYFSKNWHSNFYLYNHVNIGELLEYQAFKFLVSIIKFNYVINKVIKSNSISKIIILNDNSFESKVLKIVCENESISFIDVLVDIRLSEKIKPKDLKFFIKSLITSVKLFCHNVSLLFNSINPGFTMGKGINSIYFNPYTNYEEYLFEFFGNSFNKVILPKEYKSNITFINKFTKLSQAKIYIDNSKSIINKNDLKKYSDNLLNFDFHSVKNTPLINDILIETIKEFLLSKISESILCIDQSNWIIEKHQLEAIFVPFDHMKLDRSLVLVANNRGLLTVMFQHGILNNYKYLPKPLCNKVIAWSEESKNCYVKFGVSENNILIKSSRYYDKLINDNSYVSTINTNYNNVKILFASQPFVGLTAFDDRCELNQIFLDIIKCAENFGNITFYIKLHPEDVNTFKEDLIKKLISKKSNIKLVNGNSLSLIKECDIVLSETSTCLLESISLNKVSISYNKRRLVRLINPYLNNKIVHIVNSNIELTNILTRINSNFADFSNKVKQLSKTSFDESYDIYYNDRRWDVFSLVPSSVSSVLDVGCGEGWLGNMIKSTRNCNIFGVELVEEAAIISRNIYGQVNVINLDENIPNFGDKKFDCIVYSDILEHLNDPMRVFNSFNKLMCDNGTLILSLPNISHYSIILNLLKNNFSYTKEGILDETHKKFFTSNSIQLMLDQSNLEVITHLKNLSAGRIMRFFNILTFKRFEYLLVFQNIYLLRKKIYANN